MKYKGMVIVSPLISLGLLSSVALAAAKTGLVLGGVKLVMQRLT